MKKRYLALALLPAIFGAAGFGLGRTALPLPDSATEAGVRGAPRAADEVLETMITEEARREAADLLRAPKAPAGPAQPRADHTAEPAAAPVADPAPTRSPGVTAGAEAAAVTDRPLLNLGRMTIPVQNAGSVTYVVSDIGVALGSDEIADHYTHAENAARLRDTILTSLHGLADGQVLRGPTIDATRLSTALTDQIAQRFGSDVGDVVFFGLYRADVPRG